MAKVKYPAGSLGAMQEGEIRLVKYLEVNLPDCHYLVPNLSLTINNKNGQVQVLEYDLIVVSPHAVFNIENKDWGGRLEGDDRYWYVNGKERKNPLITNKWKTGVLASKLRERNRKWGKAWVETMITLSHIHQTKHGLWGVSPDATFLLNDELVQFIDDSHSIDKDHDAIEDIQETIVDFLIGAHAGIKKEERKRIFEYDIIEVLDQSDNYIEYLCKPADIASSLRYRIKEYALSLMNLPLDEREQQRNRIKNQYYALRKIKTNIFILNVAFRIDEENHNFYEITEYLDENSLRSELKRSTFTFEEKVNIIDNLITALEAAHDVNVYHRDINPDNIFLTSGYATLGNFGKSYFIDHQQQGFTVMPTLTDKTVGPYHALELLSGDVSRSSDIYSLGVLIYELFVGKLPIADPIELNRLGGKLPLDRVPTAVNSNLPEWLDELSQRTILSNPDDRWDTLEELKAFLKKHAHQKESTQNIAAPSTNLGFDLENLEPGSRIGAYTIYEPIGKGGFSRVYKVRHSLQGKDYAMKVFNESVDAGAVQREYQALKDLSHPNIVKFTWNDLLPNGQFYTLMEYIEGQNMKDYTHGDLRLSLGKVYELGERMLDALVYMQEREQPLYHRDIKPHNILWNKQERFVLIDFNVSAIAEADNNYVGTNPYIAPDLAISAMQVNWDKSADTFALGITLYELVCKKYPWPNRMPLVSATPINPREHNANISEAFSKFLLMAIQPKKQARFADAKSMLAALTKLTKDQLIKEKTIDRTPPIIIDNRKGVTNPDENNFVDYVNTLFSQSRHGNAGTRARQNAHPYDKITYTDTYLDRKLTNTIKQGEYKLVIITGNAGDGKTAFIHKIERQADRFKALAHSNGGEFHIQNVRYLSNYDGSQDQQERANDEVLSDFFQPFENLQHFHKAKEGRIIAINEGRLVEFLETSEKYKHLSDVISDYFLHEGENALPSGIMIINLNLRSVTAAAAEEESILRAQIKRLTTKSLWKKCDGCSLKNKCFIKYNVDSFSDEAAGEELISRLEWLIQTGTLRREFHITMRDLRSFLAFMLTRDQRCEDIETLYQKGQDRVEEYIKYYYFNISNHLADDDGNNDRLVRLIRDIDVAQTPLPQKDRDLYFDRHQSGAFIDFENREIDLLDVFNNQKQILPAHERNEQKHIQRIQNSHNLFARHQYFEGKIEYKKRLPYHSVFAYLDLLQNPNDAEKCETTLKNVAKAIAINEGCDHAGFYDKYIVLSSSHVNDPYSFSFRLFPLTDFELKVNDAKALATYLEYEPDSLILSHKKETHIKLSISLDLFEMLYFIQQGFTPSLNDLKGRFVELEIFKNLLENLAYDEVIVTRDNIEYFKIQKTATLNLKLEKMTI